MKKVRNLNGMSVAVVMLSHLLVSTHSANATLIGDDITIRMVSGGADFTQIETVVDPGAEITGNDGSSIGNNILVGGESIDIGDASITLVFIGTFPDNAFISFTDLDWVNGPGAIVGFTTIDGVDITASDVSFTADSVTIDITTGQFGETFVVNLDVQHLSTGVPEPVTATLGLMGLGVLGVATRRRVV